MFRTRSEWLRLTSIICAALVLPGDVPMRGQAPAGQPAAATPPAAADSDAPKTPEQLDSLVAPIALYPDPLLAQVLAASTYPLELIQLQQWLSKHKDLKDKAL